MSIRKGRLTSQGVIAAPNIVEHPIGTVLAFAGPNTAIPEGYLLCDGSEVNRNDFAALFDIIGTFWGSGNGTTTFRIPTTQGLILRGQANGSGFDPDRATRTAIQTGGAVGDQVGSYQSNRFGSHNHGGGSHAHGLEYNTSGASSYTSFSSAGSFSTNTQSGGSYMRFSNSTSYNNSLVGASGTIISTQGSNQTVGNNIYVNYIIKY